MNPQETWHTIRPILLKRYQRTETFLNFRTTWELLVAVILSAQMTDEGVNAITGDLFEKFPTVQSMAQASITDITSYIKKINYYNAKARYLKQTAQIIANHFNGVVPDTPEDLMTLPGVGRKTAVAVLANGFGKYVGIAVDTHVIRFAQRFKLSHRNNPSMIEQDLLRIIKSSEWNSASYAIKEYGRKEGRARGYDAASDPLALALLAQTQVCVYTTKHMAKRISQDIKNKVSRSKKTKKRLEIRYAAKKAAKKTTKKSK
jgi:endonuclease-3